MALSSHAREASISSRRKKNLDVKPVPYSYLNSQEVPSLENLVKFQVDTEPEPTLGK